jgi:hypothetical protein
MTQRDIGAEIVSGLKEIAAWEKGEIELKTTELKLPKSTEKLMQVFCSSGAVICEQTQHCLNR